MTATNSWMGLIAAAGLLACAASDDMDGPGDGSMEVDGGAPVEDEQVELAPENVIDDLDDGDASIDEIRGRIGAWYTYNDETAAGSQTPDPAGEFAPAAGGPRDVGFMAATAGSGFTEWGAGMGFDLNNPGDAKGVWDGSSFTGIAFYARGNVPVRVAIATRAVVPETAGGTCTPGPAEGEECDDAHGEIVTLDTTWRQYVIPFAGIAQDGWGRPAAFDAATLTGIQFQIAQGVEFDVAIDEIGFYE